MEATGKRYIEYGSRADEITIWCLADIHLGSRAVEMGRLRQDIERIRQDPFSFWVGGGDYADYIGLGDKRFDPKMFADDLLIGDLGQMGAVLTRKVRDLFEPIKHKCLGLLLGNHEQKYQRMNQQENLHSWLCMELGVPNLEYSGFLDIVFVRASVKEPRLVYKRNNVRQTTAIEKRLYVHHGAGGATTPGGKLNRLIRFMYENQADLFMIGHVHDQKSQKLILMGADNTCLRLKEVVKLGIVTGSYLMTYAQGCTSYGEEKGYAPVPLGMTGISIIPDKDRVWARV